jgi:hypothetical protein
MRLTYFSHLEGQLYLLVGACSMNQSYEEGVKVFVISSRGQRDLGRPRA